MIAYLWPMLLVILVADKSNRFKALIGGLVGFIGISFIILDDSGLALNWDYLLGYGLAACCALIWSLYSWFLSTSGGDVDDIGWLSLVVALLSLLAHFLLEVDQWQFEQSQWVGVISLGLGPVGGAFYLWDQGLKKGNKSLLASLSFTTPLISSVALAGAGVNNWSFDIMIALSLILTGAWIANKPRFLTKAEPMLKVNNRT